MENEQMFERTVKPVLDVNEKPKADQWVFLSLQHLFAMFGATVLVPNRLANFSSIACIRNRDIALYLNYKINDSSVLRLKLRLHHTDYYRIKYTQLRRHACSTLHEWCDVCHHRNLNQTKRNRLAYAFVTARCSRTSHHGYRIKSCANSCQHGNV